MTGHGRGTHEQSGRRATVELRSVNHRFFDLKVRAPFTDPGFDAELERALRKRVQRGALSVLVRQEGTSDGEGLRVDVEAARRVAAALDEVRVALGRTDHVPLELVLAQPGVITTADANAADGRWELFAPAVEAALRELDVMRAREGATLAKDLGERLTKLEALAEEIATRSAGAPAETAKRLGERVQKLLAQVGGTLDKDRLEVELALLADRQDVTEELVRLKSHVAQARALLAGGEPVGRKLDFLVQELGREVNTIGSKSQLAELARLVVEAKAELERIREQIQNVE